jgi:3-oxoacyl-[acyl-carrier protein] reductase
VTALAGKTALVTGGSRGIGAAIVRGLADGGACVAFTHPGPAERAEAAGLVRDVAAGGRRALAIEADSASAQDVRVAVGRTVAESGGLDILVNNAGVGYAAALEDFELERLDHMLAVNVRGAFVAVQSALPYLGSGGRIISIGSVNADRVPINGLSAYALTKAAVAGLTRALARELGPRGITVNVVQPGPTDTGLNPADGPNAAHQKAMLSAGRFAQPTDIASAVCYLARPEAWFVNGSIWNVDGGYTV